LKDVTVQICRI